MQTRKIWWLLSLLCPLYVCKLDTGVEIITCSHPTQNKPCNITCRVPDFTQLIEFQCNGYSRGQCLSFLCHPNMIKEGGNTIHLEIASLSYTNDSCEWTCTYGAFSSFAVFFPIYSGFVGTPDLKSQSDSYGVKLTATADCVYPSNPIVDIMYSYQSSGQYIPLKQRVDILQSSTAPGTCSSDIEKRITAIFYVSGHSSELKEKTVFFRVRFLQYINSTPTMSNEVGPFSFKGTLPGKLVAQMQESNSDYSYILYGVGAVLCTSLGLNGCTIAWILRQRKRKGQEVTREKKSDESANNDSNPRTGIYDIPEDTTGYQELGQVTGPSHYDQI